MHRPTLPPVTLLQLSQLKLSTANYHYLFLFSLFLLLSFLKFFVTNAIFFLSAKNGFMQNLWIVNLQKDFIVLPFFFSFSSM